MKAQVLHPGAKSSLAFFLICFVWLIFACFVFFPGEMSTDSHDQYSQAILGKYSDHHPPTMSITWSLLMKTFNTESPGVLFLFHLAIYIAGIYAVIASNLTSLTARLVTFALVVAVLTPQMVVIWKDTGLAAAYSLSCGISCYAMQHRPTGIKKFLLAAVGALVFLYGTGLRHNSLSAAVILGPLLWYSFSGSRVIKWKQLALIALVTILLTPAIGLIERTFFTIKKDHIVQHLLVHDIFGVFHHAERHGKDIVNLPIPDYWQNNKAGIEWTPETIANSYIEYQAGPLLWDGKVPITSAPDDLEILRKAWFQTIFTYPMMYLEHRWGTSRHFTRIGLVGAYFPYLMDSKKKVVSANSTWSENARAQLYVFYEKLNNSAPAIFFPWVYLLICTIVILTCVFTWLCTEKQNHQIVCAISIASSGFLYLCSLFLISLAPDFRFAYWAQTASLLSLVCFFSGSTQSKFATAYSRWRELDEPNTGPESREGSLILERTPKQLRTQTNRLPRIGFHNPKLRVFVSAALAIFGVLFLGHAIKKEFSPQTFAVSVFDGVAFDVIHFDSEERSLDFIDTASIAGQNLSTSFSLRATACVKVTEPSTLSLAVTSDDGSRAFVDGNLFIDNWGDHAMVRKENSAKISAGIHEVVFEFYQSEGPAGLRIEGELSTPGDEPSSIYDVFYSPGAGASDCR